MKTLAALVAVLAACGGIASQAGVEAHMREAAATPERDFRTLIDMVRRAVTDVVNAGRQPNDRVYVCLEAIYADRVIVEVASRYFLYPYSIKAVAGMEQVVLGAPTEVVETYVPVATGDKAQQDVSAAAAAASASGVVMEAMREALPGARFAEAADGTIVVTLINAGASGNGNYYPDAALKEAVPLFEGVRVFAKSDAEHLAGKGKDVRNLIGGIYGVQFVEGATPDTGKLTGTFKAIDPKDATVVKMTEAVKRGMQDLMGLSIDAHARTKTRMQGSTRLREATKFTKVNSVDLIVEPGAGGGLDRLTEAAADPSPFNSGDDAMKNRLFEAIKARDAARAAKIDLATITDGELMAIYEAVVGGAAANTDGHRMAEAQGDNALVTRAELQMLQTRSAAATTIAASKLPQAAKDRLQADFAKRERFVEADVTEAIKAEGDYLARFTESGAVRVPNGSVSVGDRSVLMKDMLDAFFDPAHKDHRDVRSFKECYIQMTGDRNVTGQLVDIDMGRLRESLGDDFRESMTASSWSYALGNSITRRMQQVYIGQTDLQAWRKVATTVPVADFRTQERTRIGGYGNLPAVAEGGGYAALSSPGDAKATYAVTKRGGTEDVTLEMIVNDDVGAIRRIPTELALAAANTLYEFVFDFFRTNPAIYDTVALYHASHNNLFVTALSAAEYANHRLAMLKQTRAGSAKRLATAPKSILVPYELQETAYNLFVRNQNLDKTFVQSINPDVIPVSYWTDANDWCTVADPAVLPVLEIGFLQGKEEPELFVQDIPNVGSVFTNDKTTYKIRHIYSGGVLVDGEKGTTKAVVP